ncbi:MAG: aminoacetone oxidase family FAD-binding enzyme, partial [Oscillospiraceae bacterium]|nr:aminoacetone oxidase family FAD-binding enzyme [Oscillospiraceae bacterium]
MNVTVIGGGAAGLMAAISAAEFGAKVTLIERGGADNLGHKVRLTGKGRCNITNNCDAETVLKNVLTNPKFLNSAVRKFPPSAVMEFFDSIGLKTERGNRVFPISDKAGDVVGFLKRRIDELGVNVVKRRADAAYVHELLKSGKVILCTGGLSYPKTGSDGNGYKIAESLGHTVTPLSPSLIPLT